MLSLLCIDMPQQNKNLTTKHKPIQTKAMETKAT